MSDTTTWANGFGRWYAAFPSTGTRQGDAAKARRLIGNELALREGASAANYLSVTRVDDGSNNSRGHVVYAESESARQFGTFHDFGEVDGS